MIDSYIMPCCMHTGWDVLYLASWKITLGWWPSVGDSTSGMTSEIDHSTDNATQASVPFQILNVHTILYKFDDTLHQRKRVQIPPHWLMSVRANSHSLIFMNWQSVKLSERGQHSEATTFNGEKGSVMISDGGSMQNDYLMSWSGNEMVINSW